MIAKIERLEKSDNILTAAVVTGYSEEYRIKNIAEAQACFDYYRECFGVDEWDLRMQIQDKTGYHYIYDRGIDEDEVENE